MIALLAIAVALDNNLLFLLTTLYYRTDSHEGQ